MLSRVETGGRAGFTLIEVVFSIAILSVAMIGLISGLLSSMRLRELNEEKAKARSAAERVLSAMRGMDDIYSTYLRFGGGAPEETFAIQGLANPAAGVPAGRVIVWRQKDGNPPDPNTATPLDAPDLAEAKSRFGIAFPLTMVGNEGPFGNDYLDTNGDNVVDGNDTPSLMPVTIRIRWKSRAGIISEYFSTVVGIR